MLSCESKNRGNAGTGAKARTGASVEMTHGLFYRLISKLRAYPNNRVVMRPSEKFEAKAAGQKCSEAWFSPR